MRAGEELVPMSPDQLRRILAEGEPDWSRQPAKLDCDGETVVQLLDTSSYFDLLHLPYGAKTAGEIVFSLVVDDGVVSRGHRQNILNADLRLIGVAGATHPKWGQVCVMDFAQGWR